MKIMTEREYQECIKQAEMRGYEQAKKEEYQRREDEDFRQSLWREMRDLRQEVRKRIERLEKATGNEYAPTTCKCADTPCTPTPF